MEDYRWIYLAILLQAALLGTVLFLGDTLFHSSVESEFVKEITAKEIGSSLLGDYLKGFEDRWLPEESRLTGYLIEDVIVLEETDNYTVLLASISVKPTDIDSCLWNSLGSREGSWIKDIRLSVYLERDQTGKFTIVKTVPAI
ncbi:MULTISPECIES: hypothetical protein [Mesotoga]|jgi:hypothetical protein|uniref:hypothetical protein n=1 Tax=Mesotoga TaxID=1184396 RepID=UPI0002CB3FA4|nr:MULTISPECIES: hypothetical protein [Mesotoga]MCP5456973.1 hypothetical protein [Thermotogota bacterium]CCU84030.1 conserved hypothetical protein [Mesotoga infera]MCB1222360.1 hypothetical protein [Mesotoga sp.]MCP5460190.1 hypothetical protein [Thermotogota bacterium]MDK2944033.1 hypothetical protein [Mesotoga sp.]